MKTPFLCAACAAVVMSGAAYAGEITGGSVGLEYGGFTSNDYDDLDKTTLSGSVEYGFDSNFSVQGDLAIGKFGYLDSYANSITLHGIYHADDTAALGFFVGRDSLNGEDFDFDFYGLEAKLARGPISGQVYIASSDISSSLLGSGSYNSTLMGIGLSYEAAPNVTLGASYDHFDLFTYEAWRAQLEGEYRINNIALTAQIGTAKIDDLDFSEPYFGVGVRFDFGSNGRPTFDRRGALEVLPGL